MMKIVAISDTHGDLPEPDSLPIGDVLVVAGDVLPDDYRPGDRSEVNTSRSLRQGWFFDEVYVPWLGAVKARYSAVVWIPGNHDFFCQMIMSKRIKEAMPDGVYYLHEESVIIDGVKFYGAGWNHTYGWAFHVSEEELEERLRYVPEDVNVLVVHNPPYHHAYPPLHNFTAPKLEKWLGEQQRARAPLKAVICGHVHEAYSSVPYKFWDIPVYVVSAKDRVYESVNPPVELDIE